MSFDLPVMLAAALVCFPIVLWNRKIDRWQGVLLLSYYLGYLAYGWLYLAPGSASPEQAMVRFVLPLAVLTAVLLAWARFRVRRARQGTVR